MPDKLKRFYYEKTQNAYKPGEYYKVFKRGTIKQIAILWDESFAIDLVDALNDGVLVIEESCGGQDDY